MKISIKVSEIFWTFSELVVLLVLSKNRREQNDIASIENSIRKKPHC